MDIKQAILILVMMTLVFAAVVWALRWILLRRARAVGFAQVFVYLRAVPESDVQKLDALDLALKGIVITSLGVLFPPLIIIGLVPLYYGGRKVLLTLMALGLSDEVTL